MIEGKSTRQAKSWQKSTGRHANKSIYHNEGNFKNFFVRKTLTRVFHPVYSLDL
jgi:hypothetical protein